MRVLVFGPERNPWSERLERWIRAKFPHRSVVIRNNLDQLQQDLQFPGAQPQYVILMIADSEDLNRLLAIRHLIIDQPIVLVLPESSPEMVAKGHRFRPRYLTFVDEGFDDFKAVIERIFSRMETQPPEKRAIVEPRL